MYEEKGLLGGKSKKQLKEGSMNQQVSFQVGPNKVATVLTDNTVFKSILGTVSSNVSGGKKHSVDSILQLPKLLSDYIAAKDPKGKKKVVVTGVNSSVKLSKLLYDVQAAKHMCAQMIHIRNTWVKNLQTAVNADKAKYPYWRH